MMSFIMRLSFIMALTLSLFFIPSVSGEIVHISECSIIDESGYYVLDADIEVNKSKCIEIKSDGVTLDGNGRTVSAGYFGGTYAIYAFHPNGISNLTIKNIVLKNWAYGIYSKGIKNMKVDNLRIEGSFFGIYMSEVEKAIISDSIINETKKNGIVLERVLNADISTEISNTGTGILVSNSKGVSIHDSSVSGSDKGINLRDSLDVVIKNTRVNNNNNFGVYIKNTNNAEISGSEILKNSYDGIKVYNSENCRVNVNKVKQNRIGIFLEFAESCKILDNEVSDNSEGGIILSNTKDSHVTGNKLENNGKGLGSASSTLNLFNLNIIKGGEYAIAFSDTTFSTITDNRVEGAKYGIYISGDSEKNLIYLNSLNALRNAYDEGKDDSWYSPDLKKGNYYSDYRGTDRYGDGIGDQDYIIPPGDTRDIYPLMEPHYEVKKVAEKEVKIETTETKVPEEKGAEETKPSFIPSIPGFEILIVLISVAIAFIIALLRKNR